MKNIHDILAETGLTVPEDKKAAFDKAIIENYKTVTEVQKIESARDNFKTQLETAQTSLKAFGEAKPEELQQQIRDLQTQLSDKDIEYQNNLADIEFNGLLDSQLSAVKAKNVKAVKALLDVDTLKASKNQAEDIKSALASVQKENDYLFESSDTKPVITVPGNPAQHQTSASASLDSIYANNPFYNKKE